MGNYMCKCLVNQETPRQRSMRREFSKVLEEENDKIYIRNSMQMRSSFGAKNNGSSFHCRNLPQMSKENNKHFHIFPEDINMLSEIVSNNKIKILPMEFTETENYFYDQLEECKRTIFHYDTMIGVIKKSQKSQPKLLIEIVSGHDINLGKGKYFPFIEIVQNSCSVPKGESKDGVIEMNSTKGTDQTESMLNSFDTSLRKSEGLKTIKQREPIECNKLVLSTSVPIKPTKDESYEWCRFFQMHFDRDCSEKDKSFTVSLYRTKRNKNRCEKIGQSRSFFLVHLKHQELKELSLEFKESYESKCEGKVIMRMQYVNDELSLYTQILEENLKRRDLIIKCIDILTLQIQGYREGMERSIGFDIAENRNLECGSFNAAYYSEYCNDSVLESDSSIHKNRILKTDHIE